MPAVRFQDRLLDVRPDRLDLRDRIYSPALRSLPTVYPDDVSIQHYFPQYKDYVLDQGTEGACTGFGLACVINFLEWSRSWRHAVLSGAYESMAEWPDVPDVDLVSPRMLYHIARFYDEWEGEDYHGSSCRGAMKGWHRHGVCKEELWPYRDSQGSVVFLEPDEGWQADAAQRPLGAYYRVNPDSISDLQAAIYEVGAVYASSRVHAGWFNVPTNDELPIIEYEEEPVGAHAYAFVGYTHDGFILQNSWGPGWGYHGFAILAYENWVEHGMDAWVSVLGAPSQPLARSSYRFSSSRQAAARAGYVYRNDEVRKWDLDIAHQHTLVFGNEGNPISRIVDVRHAKDAVRIVAHDNVRAWLSENARHRKVVLYMHGGLTSEQDAIKRVQIMAPYFKANGIYPLFINWKTGVWETLQNLTIDAIRGERARGFFDGAGDWLKRQVEEARKRFVEASDYSLEVAAIRAVRPFWTQMKQNAAASIAGNGGSKLLVEHLVKLKKDFSDLELHAVGHSAGSILFGEILRLLVTAEFKVESCTLWAPACTLQFALERYGDAIDQHILDPDKLAIEILSDELELADSTGPYNKSILYLISRSLEAVHKTPILGMEIAWDEIDVEQRWAPEVAAWVGEWKRFAKKKRVKVSRIVTETQVNNGEKEIDATHGNFDNDIKSLTRSLELILGQAPDFKVETLAGF